MEFWDNDNLIHSFANVRSIQIETIDHCNRKCAWCPNKDRKTTPDRFMHEMIFIRILDELRSLKFDGRIHPYLNGEPLLDARIFDMIGMIRKQFPKNIIFLSTNGDLLTPDVAEKLFIAGLSELLIMDYDNSGKFEQYGEDRRINVVKRDEYREWYNRAGLVDVDCPNPLDQCEWVFQKVYINYRGEVILCCSDFNSTIVHGNINESSLMDIWLSPKYKLYRMAHFLGVGDTMPLCDKCNRIKRSDHGKVWERCAIQRSSIAVR